MLLSDQVVSRRAARVRANASVACCSCHSDYCRETSNAVSSLSPCPRLAVCALLVVTALLACQVASKRQQGALVCHFLPDSLVDSFSTYVWTLKTGMASPFGYLSRWALRLHSSTGADASNLPSFAGGDSDGCSSVP